MPEVRALLAALACTLAATPALAQRKAPAPPALVVLISVDQLPEWSLQRAWPHFGERGFRRLARDGVHFTACAHDHACTETAPGHASLATGARPCDHGITGNDWIDHATRRRVYCVEDEGVQTLGLDHAPARSPKLLLAPALGDAMKAFLGPEARVVSLALKDRSAVLLGGKAADVAAWWSPRTGSFVSSTWYGEALPAWLARWNDGRPADAFCGKTWDRFAPAAAYDGLTDDRRFEMPLPDGSRTLPVVIGGPARPGPAFYEVLGTTPFGNELLLSAVTAALEHAELGAGGPCDLLCVGFSANDPIGHRCGPDSVEARDALLRSDRDLGLLFDLLDTKVGTGRWLAMLSSDHGALPVPERWSGTRVPGGRRLITPQAAAAAEQALRAAYGPPPDGLERWVTGSDGAYLFLAPALAEREGAHSVTPADVAAAAAAKVPRVRQAFSVARVLAGDVADDELARLVRHAVHPARCGDVALVREPLWIEGTLPATHGSPWAYDREVPLFVMGPGVARGVRCDEPVTPRIGVVIAARVLRMPPPPLATARVPAGVLVD